MTTPDTPPAWRPRLAARPLLVGVVVGFAACCLAEGLPRPADEAVDLGGDVDRPARVGVPEVVPRLVKEKIAVLGMKSMGDGNVLKSGTVTPVECLHYAMNLPTSVVITGCDSIPILQQALDAARKFQPMDSSHVAALLAKTAKAAEAGQFELYKTTHHFDGTVANPQWLG